MNPLNPRRIQAITLAPNFDSLSVHLDVRGASRATISSNINFTDTRSRPHAAATGATQPATRTPIRGYPLEQVLTRRCSLIHIRCSSW